MSDNVSSTSRERNNLIIYVQILVPKKRLPTRHGSSILLQLQGANNILNSDKYIALISEFRSLLLPWRIHLSVCLSTTSNIRNDMQEYLHAFLNPAWMDVNNRFMLMPLYPHRSRPCYPLHMRLGKLLDAVGKKTFSSCLELNLDFCVFQSAVQSLYWMSDPSFYSYVTGDNSKCSWKSVLRDKRNTH